MSITDLNSSHMTRTLAAIADDDAIKTAIATDTSVATYSGAALNGVIAGVELGVTQQLTVTTSTNGATYNTTAPIVITGQNNEGVVITENFQPTAAGGNQVLLGTKAFSKVTSIAVPAQLTTGGQFKFGVGDVIFDESPRMIRAGAVGNIKVGYTGNNGIVDDTIPCVAGEKQEILPVRIYSTGTTALPITVYL